VDIALAAAVQAVADTPAADSQVAAPAADAQAAQAAAVVQATAAAGAAEDAKHATTGCLQHFFPTQIKILR